MTGRAEIAAAFGVAFGVLLSKLFPKGWPIWQEAIAVTAVCIAVYAMLKILGRSFDEKGAAAEQRGKPLSDPGGSPLRARRD